jgi:homoserine kinase
MTGSSRVDAPLVGRHIVVPGSTSNLGPGFDALGLALQLYLEVTITGVADDGRGELTFDFEGGAPPGENAIATAIRSEAGRRNVGLPSLALHVRNRIPVQAGLGSSAAAIVAGLRLVDAIAPVAHPVELLESAVRLEGHPDNVSASLLGGLTVSAHGSDGVCSLACAWPERIVVVVATPAVTLATTKARGILPATVSRADAVHNLQRAALLVQALHTGELALMRDALDDRLHQPYRAGLAPGLSEALAWRHPSLLGVFLSGAGPSVAALVVDDPAPIAERFSELYASLELDAAVRVLAVHQPSPGLRALTRRPLTFPSGALV